MTRHKLKGADSNFGVWRILLQECEVRKSVTLVFQTTCKNSEAHMVGPGSHILSRDFRLSPAAHLWER